MASVRELLAEFKHEAANTRKVLERIPDGKDEWTPHEKSMKIKALADHVSELSGWCDVVISRDELNFSDGSYSSPKPSNSAERLKSFDEQVAKSVAALEKASDEDLEKQWQFTYGGMTIFSGPKKVALRGMVYSHIIHHRAQLGVYLRLLGIPVPGIYGPTADERM
jgi:uncharacterized damage-inducible protein DinB